MSVRIIAISIFIACPLLAFSESEEPVSIDQLTWLSGCWASDGAETGSGEQWMRPAGGVMLGMSRFVHGGKAVAFEFIRIFEDEDGSLTFFAAPSGQPSHAFGLASISADEVVFSDPQHDFPQRILYRLIEPDRLLGRIEGISKGEARAVDFSMTREDCDI